jgi:23S rRNA (cytosine1962-C5)-methyltransferase
METQKIILKQEKAGFFKSTKHPWIFEGALSKVPVDLPNGSWVEIVTNKNETIGWGIYSKQSMIRVRIVSYSEEQPAESWLEERIGLAFAFREKLNISSNAYRLINSEGDFIPGLTVDVYNTTTVVRPLIRYMEINIGRITSALEKLYPGNKIYLKRDEYAVRNELLTLENGYLQGDGDGTETIAESGMAFHVDIATGQKTGFYLDQRDSRNMFLSFCKDKNVLNLFSYSGAFSVAAAKGEAKRVVSVDSSQLAVSLGKKNMEQNGFTDQMKYEWICDDAFKMIENADMFDIIVVDPPPFARKKREVEGAVSGYVFLNEKAITLCTSGGFVFTFSCSQAVSRDLFHECIFDAGLRSGKNVKVVKELQAAPDHTTSLFHPEGNYLKGYILYVE